MPTPFDAIAGIANACQVLPNLLTGGQPGARQLEAMSQAGVATVLDLRDPMEPRPIDEAGSIQRLGMSYVIIPVTPNTLNDATLERILTVLRENKDHPVLVHCGSGNRVGAALIPHLMLDQGLGEEDAIHQAMRIGLRAPDLLEWGLDYVKRHPKEG